MTFALTLVSSGVSLVLRCKAKSVWTETLDRPASSDVLLWQYPHNLYSTGTSYKDPGFPLQLDKHWQYIYPPLPPSDPFGYYRSGFTSWFLKYIYFIDYAITVVPFYFLILNLGFWPKTERCWLCDLEGPVCSILGVCDFTIAFDVRREYLSITEQETELNPNQ